MFENMKLLNALCRLRCKLQFRLQYCSHSNKLITKNESLTGF